MCAMRWRILDFSPFLKPVRYSLKHTLLMLTFGQRAAAKWSIQSLISEVTVGSYTDQMPINLSGKLKQDRWLLRLPDECVTCTMRCQNPQWSHSICMMDPKNWGHGGQWEVHFHGRTMFSKKPFSVCCFPVWYGPERTVPGWRLVLNCRCSGNKGGMTPIKRCEGHSSCLLLPPRSDC